MENTVELQVDFWQKVRYSGTIRVTKEEAEQLRDEDGAYIKQYLREDGVLTANPLWDLLSDVATESNAYDWEDELEDFEITEDSEINE